MSDEHQSLRNSALVMRLVGGRCRSADRPAVRLSARVSLGVEPESFPHIGRGTSVALRRLHRIFHAGALYVAYGILMIRGTRPKANAALFDFGILSSVLHGLVMIPQAFYYPTSMRTCGPTSGARVITLVLWIWHPNRILRRA